MLQLGRERHVLARTTEIRTNEGMSRDSGVGSEVSGSDKCGLSSLHGAFKLKSQSPPSLYTANGLCEAAWLLGTAAIHRKWKPPRQTGPGSLTKPTESLHHQTSNGNTPQRHWYKIRGCIKSHGIQIPSLSGGGLGGDKASPSPLPPTATGHGQKPSGSGPF